MPSVFQNLSGFDDEAHPLKPSIEECQVVRIQFLTPEGIVEQATFSTTWDMPGFTDAFRGVESDDAAAFVDTISSCSWMAKMGCDIINVELVGPGRREELC